MTGLWKSPKGNGHHILDLQNRTTKVPRGIKPELDEK